MLDVFLRVAPLHPIRAHLAEAVYLRWLEEAAYVRVIKAEGSLFGAFEATLPLENFQWTSRAYADENAKSDPYILADDDHLPLGKDFVSRFEREWDKYPGYALFSAASAVRGEAPYQGALWQEGVTEEPACVGATMLHAKRVIPYSQFNGKASNQDSIVCDWLKAHGYKFALSKSVHYLHLGFGLSQVEPLLFGRY
jgi:hypothetical protein